MSSYESPYHQGKGAHAPRPSTSSTMSSGNYLQSAHSSRSYSSRPKTTVIVHNPSGPSYDTNTSTSAGNIGYYR